MFPSKDLFPDPCQHQLVAQQSKLVGFDVCWEGWGTGEQRKSSWCSPATLWVPSQSCSCSSSLCRCLISFRPCSALHLKPQECSAAPVWLQCCAHSLIPASRASPSLRMLCLPLVITELETASATNPARAGGLGCSLEQWSCHIFREVCVSQAGPRGRGRLSQGSHSLQPSDAAKTQQQNQE